MPRGVLESLSLQGRVAVITGGAGLLGRKHAEAIAEMGGIPVPWDLDGQKAVACAQDVADLYQVRSLGLPCDITLPESVSAAFARTVEVFGQVDILVNNAANNPKVEDTEQGSHWSRLESFPLDRWHADIAVGLTGAFLCSRVIGSDMAKRGRGAILNIGSDLGLIAPDQRLYREVGHDEDQQPVKPVTYSVVKAGLLGLTRYLATYWADRGVRVNAICPGGVYAGQNAEFVERLSNLIPLGRMAHGDEYKAAVVFLVSDASSYMTGSIVVVDGGRTCW